MEHWDELRTTYILAKRGTVSAAADALGVHRATVVRHVDTLEGALGAPLFHRHRRGYLLTEAGEDLLATASIVDEQLEQLVGRTRGRSLALAGELTITAMSLFTPVVLELVDICRQEHPDLRLRYEVGDRVLRLDHGEAHIALRLGRRPDHPDEVVQALPRLHSGLYAHPSYLERHGSPSTDEELAQHAFVVEQHGGPSARWLGTLVDDARIALWSPDAVTSFQAVARGVGLGFCPDFVARRLGLVQVRAGLDAWAQPVWVVTHRAMHRSARVRWVSSRLNALVTDELA